MLFYDRPCHRSGVVNVGGIVRGVRIIVDGSSYVGRGRRDRGVTKILRLRAENAAVNAECNVIIRDSSIRIIATFQKPFGNVNSRRQFARLEFVTFAPQHVLCSQSLSCLHALVYY